MWECRAGSERPQEARMLQLTAQVAYLHQAHAFCQQLQDALDNSLVQPPTLYHAGLQKCRVHTFAYNSRKPS